MIISQQGIDLIKHYESCSLTAYRDSTGILTIGYGHTGRDVREGETISPDTANQLLVDDLQSFENMLNDRLDTDIEQYQFDALMSFLFNIGPGQTGVKDGLFCLKNGNPSTLWKMVQSSDFSSASKQFLLWNRAGGVVLRGLTYRRQSESLLFSTGELKFFN
ncbi:MAG: endolysin/autolysin [Caudoviricetes sp.]|nr:MAG: endolysin/autolysin [Caudoviricetes sp.]